MNDRQIDHLRSCLGVGLRAFWDSPKGVKELSHIAPAPRDAREPGRVAYIKEHPGRYVALSGVQTYRVSVVAPVQHTWPPDD